jgi:hypothetical protein
MTAATAASMTPDPTFPEIEPFPQIDLALANSTTFRGWIEQAKAWAVKNEAYANDFEHPDGWTNIDQEFQRKAWIKNAANRDPSFANVRFLAGQMTSGEFKETGVPLIFDVHGNGVDLQHRILAGLASQVTFPSYIVNLRQDIPSVFAYYDQGKPRTHGEILKTAGYGPISGLLAMSTKLAMLYEDDLLTAKRAQSLGKIAPKLVLDFQVDNPELRQAANLMSGQYKSATKAIDKPDVATVACYLIIKAHDEAMADEFMEAIGIETEQDEFRTGDPIAVLQHELGVDKFSKEAMKHHEVLGMVLKCFNAWLKQEPVKKLGLRTNEPFPRLWGKAELMAQAKAAE